MFGVERKLLGVGESVERLSGQHLHTQDTLTGHLSTLGVPVKEKILLARPKAPIDASNSGPDLQIRRVPGSRSETTESLWSPEDDDDPSEFGEGAATFMGASDLPRKISASTQAKDHRSRAIGS